MKKAALLSLMLLGAGSSGCIWMRVMPAKIAKPANPPRQSTPSLRVDTLDFSEGAYAWKLADKYGQKRVPFRSRYYRNYRNRFAKSFLQALRTELIETPTTLTSTLAAEALPRPRVSFRLQVFVQGSENRTGILDLLYLQPFAPGWGRMGARIKVWAVVGDEDILVSDEQIEEEFSSFIRHSSSEAQVRRLYRKLLVKTAKNITSHMPDLIRVMNGQNRRGLRRLTASELSQLRTEFEEGLTRLQALEVQTNRQFIPQTGYRVIQSPPPHMPSKSVWAQYLGALGGLELARREGLARVSSRAQNSAGQTETLGTGEARSRGYRVALYNPPSQTGYFFPPSFGFLSQEITISGFNEDVPEVSLPGSNDIVGVISDPSTGGLSDLVLEPIGYGLELQSLYLGQGIGLDLVSGTDSVRVFLTAQLAVNLLEARHTDVQIHNSRKTGYSFEFAQSLNASGQLGVYFPKAHLAFRLSGEFEYYRDFDFPDPVDFLGTARFNREKQVFERERIFVDGASLLQLNGQLSAIYMF